jgi:hypothetical protein
MKFYTSCRTTWRIENSFSHLLLRYCPKRLSFSYDSYVMRNQLAVLDNVFHCGRDVQTTGEGLPVIQAQVSRRTKEWVAYRKLTSKKYEYMPGQLSLLIYSTIIRKLW